MNRKLEKRHLLPALMLLVALLLVNAGQGAAAGPAPATAAPIPEAAECDACDYLHPYRNAGASEEAAAAPTPTAELPVVQAVLFWMEGCPHCHEVIEKVLPPLQDRYGEQLVIHMIELNSAESYDRLVRVAAALGVPKEQAGVPFLIVGERALIGSEQIPRELPGLIEAGLAAGGVEYLELPGLAEEDGAEAAAAPAGEPPASGDPTGPISGSEGMVSNGFGLAVVVLALMIAALVFAGLAFFRGKAWFPALRRVDWATPVLAALGLLVAGYLAYVETQLVAAVCGPIGDCNAVQGSEYARLFGWLPIGVLGLIGYILILAAWAWKRVGGRREAQQASLAIFGMAAFGTLFSIYLTYLEPFVIRAVCIWCLTSAVIITLLLVLNTPHAVQARFRVKR